MKKAKNNVRLDLNEETIPIMEQISEGMPGGFFIYHADGDEELIFINRTMLRIFGCDTMEEFKELTGNTFKGIVHPEDYEQIEKSIHHQIENSVYDLDYVEYRIIQKDGTVRWLEDYGHFVHTEIYGDIFYVFVEDATDRLRERMEKLEQLNTQLLGAYSKEKQYRKAILSDAVTYFEINLTKDCFLTKASQMENGQEVDLFQFMGVEPFQKFSEYVKYWADYAEPAQLESYWNFFDLDRLIRCYSKGELEQTYDCWITDSYGRKRLTHYVLLLGKNEHSRDVIALSIAKDMTGQVERQHLLQSALQQAKVASVAREVFLSNMSHDIRTPLNAIIGYTELARQHRLEHEKVEGYIEKIRQSSEQLLSIVNESLEVTRIESGNVSLSKTDFFLDEMLDDVEETFVIPAQEKKLDFSIDKSELKHVAVFTDFVRMKEMLSQLLDNAVKYTQPGGYVRLTVKEKDIHLSDYFQYQFIVEDNGIGISDDFMDKMFEPFARENNTTHSGVLGTGLGLVLVKNILDMMEGEIKVESTYGKGSRFTVTILLQLQREKESHNYKEEKYPQINLEEEDIRVLLAEDNEINREIVVELLGDIGYTVESAENGKIVLEKLKNSIPGYYSIILMDIQMPVMDGYETTRKIRSLDNKVLSHIPIVALSANAFAEDFQKSREAGMDAHVTKPINIDHLLNVMNQTIKHSGVNL